MRIYLDTSAYIRSFFNDELGLKLNNVFSENYIITSSLLIIEAERTFFKLSREGKITSAYYLNCINKIKADVKNILTIDISNEIFLNGIFPPLQIPKTLDLIHLRTALSAHKEEKIDLFLSLDNKLNESARAFGFSVTLP